MVFFLFLDFLSLTQVRHKKPDPILPAGPTGSGHVAAACPPGGGGAPLGARIIYFLKYGRIKVRIPKLHVENPSHDKYFDFSFIYVEKKYRHLKKKLKYFILLSGTFGGIYIFFWNFPRFYKAFLRIFDHNIGPDNGFLCCFFPVRIVCESLHVCQKCLQWVSNVLCLVWMWFWKWRDIGLCVCKILVMAHGKLCGLMFR